MGWPLGVTDKEYQIIKLLNIDPGMSYVDIAKELGISKKTIVERQHKHTKLRNIFDYLIKLLNNLKKSVKK